MKKIILLSILALSLIANIFFVINLKKTQNPSISDAVSTIDTLYIQEPLSEWELFTLALMKVESGYNNDAVSTAGAKGYFQITPIYVKEVNRVHKTSYTFDQVTDFKTAYEIFDLMQQAHNPSYNMDKALTIHNGDHLWYRKRVYQAMDQIKLYEEMRSKVKNI